jgi:hypothetical protein
MPFFATTADALILSSNGNVNVTAMVYPTAPTEAAFIDQPQDNERVKTTPLVVVGRCGAGLLVRINNNGQLAGSVVCAPDSTFTANIVLNIGKNVLSILNYDSFEQPGPASPNVTIYVDAPPVVPGGASSSTTSEAEISQAVGTPLPEDTTQIDRTKTAQRIFEGTVIEPIAKLLNLNTAVSSSTNTAVSVAVSATFVMCLVALLALVIL